MVKVNKVRVEDARWIDRYDGIADIFLAVETDEGTVHMSIIERGYNLLNKDEFIKNLASYKLLLEKILNFRKLPDEEKDRLLKDIIGVEVDC